MKRSFLLLCATAFILGANSPAQITETSSGSKTNATPGKDKIYPSLGSIERLDPALDKLIATNVFIEKLARGFRWAEGPVWDKRGQALYFSDVPQNVIFKWQIGVGTKE